jgi:hypothetical protein
MSKGGKLETQKTSKVPEISNDQKFASMPEIPQYDDPIQ